MKENIIKPAFDEVDHISSEIIRNSPYLLSGILVLIIFLLLAWGAKKVFNYYLTKSNANPLAIRALTNITFIFFFAVGFFIALRVSGFTSLALTLAGGTGLVGIGLGLALRGTFENYIAGISLSLRKSFRSGDLVEIQGRQGVIQAINARSTLIMDLEGNNIAIPNSQVYNNTIKNFTYNPKMRLDFLVGISYDESIDHVRHIILNCLDRLSEMILKDPEPFVCVDSLGSATVNLRVYFWLDSKTYSFIKMKSLVIENVKEALMQANIELPDDAREIIFSNPLKIQRQKQEESKPIKSQKVPNINKPKNDIYEDMSSETNEIKKQSSEIGKMEKGQNLL